MYFVLYFAVCGISRSDFEQNEIGIVYLYWIENYKFEGLEKGFKRLFISGCAALVFVKELSLLFSCANFFRKLGIILYVLGVLILNCPHAIVLKI